MELEDSEVKKSQGIFDRKSFPERNQGEDEDRDASWKRSSKTLPKHGYDPLKEIEQIVEEISESESNEHVVNNRGALIQKKSMRPSDAVHL